MNGRERPGSRAARMEQRATEGMDMLWEEEQKFLATTKELRDTGLWDRFAFAHSNWLTGYLRHATGKLGALVSAYNLTNDKRAYDDACTDMPHARLAYLDSGCISVLVECAKGKADGAKVRDWMERQELLFDMTHRLHEAGVAQGVVFAMDLPQYSLLDAAGIGMNEAMDLTVRNAGEFYVNRHQLPPGWKPVFTVQGQTQAAALECLEAYEDLGIVDEVRAGTAWLAVGGQRDTKPPALYTIFESVATRVAAGTIHALGVSRTTELVYMARRGWVQSADSSSSAQEVMYNRGPYQVKGPRPLFLVEGLFAANSLRLDSELAAALAKADAEPLFEQEALL